MRFGFRQFTSLALMSSPLGEAEGPRRGRHESRRGPMNTKSVSAVVLLSVAVFLVISSFATLTEGEEGSSLFPSRKDPSSTYTLRLLSVDIPQSGNLSHDIVYWTTVHFEADVNPEIRRACFNFSGGIQTCVDVQAKDVIYGSHPYFRVPIHVPAGTKKIDCYAEYIRDRETRRTNTVTYHVIVMKPN